MNLYPIMLDVRDRPIVIIGGGNVAARKARGLLEAGATRIRAVAPSFAATFPDAIERIAERYDPRHLEAAALVFAATNDPAVNTAIVRDAHALGLFVCRADSDESDPGDFLTPAQFRDDAILVCVTTANPALSAAIRDSIAADWDPRFSAMAAAMQTLRPQILANPNLDQNARAEIFRDLATDEALVLLAHHGHDALHRWLLERHPKLT